MATSKITTNTPIRLQHDVCEAFACQYEELIEDHGPSFAVNFVLANLLRPLGHLIPELETATQKLSKTQTRRWAAEKEALSEAEAKLERQRELKRERDRRRRARLKAEKEQSQAIEQLTTHDPDDGR
jgi:hypothetical protein